MSTPPNISSDNTQTSSFSFSSLSFKPSEFVTPKFNLEQVDPSNTTKAGVYLLLSFGIGVPILLMILSFLTPNLRTTIIIYISLFLFGMALWYLIYAVRQYISFRNYYKNIDINLQLKI